MRSIWVLSTALLSALAAAQDFSQVPTCAFGCFIGGIKQSGCQLMDTKCLCTTGMQMIRQAVEPCVKTACSPTDAAAVEKAAGDICRTVVGSPMPQGQDQQAQPMPGMSNMPGMAGNPQSGQAQPQAQPQGEVPTPGVAAPGGMMVPGERPLPNETAVSTPGLAGVGLNAGQSGAFSASLSDADTTKISGITVAAVALAVCVLVM